MIPILYERGETEFRSNGLGRLPDCGMCQVTEERNGIFEVQFTYPVTGHNYANIQEGRIIFVTHDESGVAQPFDIYARSEPIDGVVTFYAHHISYRLSRVILKPFTATTCAAALAAMEQQTYNANPFTFWTDKTTSGSFAVTAPAPVRETLGGKAGSILDAFGKGDYEWDGFTVKLWLNRGRETGVTIRYGVNMTDYSRDLNYWESYSGAVPFWADPETGELVTPGVVYAEGYDASNAEIIAMDLSENWDTKPTEAQVRAKAEQRMRNNQSWLPTDNIKISFAQMWQTDEYSAVAPLQRVRLCDKVNVIYGPGNVVVNNVQIIRVVWDALLDRYDSMELGTARANLEQMIRQSVEEGILKIVPTKSYLQAALDHATELIQGGLGGHLVINTDADGHPNELLIMDTDDVNTAVNVWRWNLNGLGHSHSGYDGPFDDVAITMDGRINASMIVTGFMSAARLKGGTIDGESVNAKLFQIVDAAGNVIASFNDTITIGQPTDIHIQMDFNSFEMYDKESNEFLSIGDLRNKDGYLDRVESEIASQYGVQTAFFTKYPADQNSTISVSVDGVVRTDYTITYYNSFTTITFRSAIPAGSTVEISYRTTIPIYHYDLGMRKAGTDIGRYSFVCGNNNEASGICSHAEGADTTANGNACHAEGSGTIASYNGSHAEGSETIASNGYAHAEGEKTTASGWVSHAEGSETIASNYYSHAEGHKTKADGQSAHAEGEETVASGWGSHAEGQKTTANEYGSHAEGVGTIANKEALHVFGQYNIPDPSPDGGYLYVEIVGQGDSTTRKNIRTLTWAGNEWIAGSLTQASDERLKTECGDVPDVAGIKARRFKWNEKKGRHDDREHIGYFAQDVEAVAPYLVSVDDMGFKSLDYIGFLVAKVASLEARLEKYEREGSPCTP